MSASLLILGDSLVELAKLRPDSVDAIVTDPPAGIGFMGKDWDSDKGGRDGWIKWLAEVMRECLRALKPGGHALVWAIPRTSHWTAAAIESAGFVIRDVVTHLFGTGFPKSLNLGGGLGTALKPASEHWILARKPLDGTVAANVLLYGTGALNIDACRIKTDESLNGGAYAENGKERYDGYDGWRYKREGGAGEYQQPVGRWPANLILSHSEHCADNKCAEGCPVADLDDRARYYYVTKPSRSEKEAGLDHLPLKTAGEATGGREEGSAGLNSPRAGAGRTSGARNHHPTVKGIELMRYLCRLITPADGVVLDPFTGSGSTGVAALSEGFRFVGIERESEYFVIAQARIENATKNLDAAITTELNVQAVAIESESGSWFESGTSTSTEIENESEDTHVAGLPKEMAEEVGKARVAGGGNYIQHGDYVMMIDRWFYQKIQDRCIIQELTPAEAIKKAVYEGTKKVEQDPNPAGSSCSATVNFDGAGKLSAQSNSRAPVIALFGFNDGEIPDATAAMSLRQVCKEDESDADLKGVPIQPARGMLIGLRTYPKEIQSKKGNYITGLNWYCIAKPGTGLNAPDLVKARLDAKVMGPDAFVKCVTEQLVTARAAGQVKAPDDELPGTVAGAAAPALPGAVPALPPSLPIEVVDPLAGWTLNPANPAGAPDPYYYKGQEQKKKSELLAAAQK